MKRHAIVIVGAGQGGFQLALSLRGEGFQGSITLIGDEPYPPYQRPPLSKAYLLGKQSADGLLLRQMNWYRENDVRLRTNIRAVRIERDAKRLILDDGTAHNYDTLVLATGARIRSLPIEGADLAGIHALRSLDDADAIASATASARSVVVIGGGFIGLEFAAVAGQLGKEVIVIESQPHLMARATSPVISAFFEDAHRAMGVNLMLGCNTERLIGENGRIRFVEITYGQRFVADMVLVGIGVEPNVELATEAGLTCERGIEVDAMLRTDDPAIYAIGDCVTHHNAFADMRMRVESVQNAVDQARFVAAAIMGRADAYRAVPWFWSDQYDLKLQMVGFSAGHDRVILRGSQAERQFSAFYYRDGRLLGIDSVNRAGDHMLGRKLLEHGIELPITAVEDEGTDLKSFLRQA